MMLPTLNAQRFVRAVQASQFAVADGFFRDPKDRFLDAYNKQFWTFQLQVDLDPFSANQFWNRERRVNFHVAYGGPKPLTIFDGTIIANSDGLSSPEISGGVNGGITM
jgi:hypothetical protein